MIFFNLKTQTNSFTMLKQIVLVIASVSMCLISYLNSPEVTKFTLDASVGGPNQLP